MTTVFPSIFRTNAGSATPGGAGIVTSGKGDGWINIHHQTQSSYGDYSVFLNQNSIPSSKPTSKAIQVQDSGVSLPSFTAHSSVGSQQGSKHSVPISKLIPPSGQETIDDDWEMLYPDN
jgi:hypothetical protein